MIRHHLKWRIIPQNKPKLFVGFLALFTYWTHALHLSHDITQHLIWMYRCWFFFSIFLCIKHRVAAALEAVNVEIAKVSFNFMDYDSEVFSERIIDTCVASHCSLKWINATIFVQQIVIFNMFTKSFEHFRVVFSHSVSAIFFTLIERCSWILVMWTNPKVKLNLRWTIIAKFIIIFSA